MKYDKFIKEHLESNPDFIEDCIPFIQKHLEKTDDLTELAQKLGYKNKAISIGANRLMKMINEPLLGLDDVDTTYFDGTHGAKSLVDALLYEVYPDEESRYKAKKVIALINTKLDEYTVYIIKGKDGKQKRVIASPNSPLLQNNECQGCIRR